MNPNGNPVDCPHRFDTDGSCNICDHSSLTCVEQAKPKQPDIPAIFHVMAQAAEKMGCHLMDVIDAVNRAKGLDGTAAGYRITLQIIEHWQAVRSTVRWYPPREDEIADLRDKLGQAEHIELLARAVETFLG